MKAWHFFYFFTVATLLLSVSHAQPVPVYQGEEVVVTTVVTHEPLRVETNPRAPRQPVPAADGAGLLKTIPGIAVSRKGGISGDPLLRGLGGSRFAVLADGAEVLGGCGGRMDPPTAYLYPDAYDNVTVFKGPQTVLLGPGLVAGAVNFERKTAPFTVPGIRSQASLLAGLYDRLDGYVDVTLGQPSGYIRLIGNHNQGGDYKDGAGEQIHSAFQRESQTLTAGLTPDSATTVEMTFNRSRGYADFADRRMDGSRFDRDAWSIKAEQRTITNWLEKLRFQYVHGYVDHVMDNYSLRPIYDPNEKDVGNPDRTYNQARIMGDMAIGALRLTLGSEWQQNWHKRRRRLGANAGEYTSLPRIEDQRFVTSGIFTEARLPLTDTEKLIAGWRYDQTKATYPLYASTDPTREQSYPLHAAFLRYEKRRAGLTQFIGFGQSQRAPDFWERNDFNQNANRLRKETSYQLDTGLIYTRTNLSASLALFANRIDDFIMIDKRTEPATARNINAQRFGFEADTSWQFAAQWKVVGTLSYVYANNLTDGLPLAQTMPLEGTVSVAWDNGTHAAALLIRGVQRQDRYAIGQGNAISTDIGATGGFGVVSLNSGWRFNKHIQLTAGIDNLFNKNYAESVSRAAYPVPGYSEIGRVNEPGLALWSKIHIKW